MLIVGQDVIDVVKSTWDDVQKWHIDNPIYIEFPNIETKANAHYAKHNEITDPHKPILHASYCLIMSTQFTVAALLSIIKQQLNTIFLPISSEQLAVLRRRLIIQKVEMTFNKPIGNPVVTLK